MAEQKYICSGSKLTSLANAIREKAKTADKYTIDQMVSAVNNLASVEKIGSGDWFWGFYADSGLVTKLTDKETADRIIDGQRVYASYNTYINPSGKYFATCTDEELAGMVAAHYSGNIKLSDYWSVNDTRKISLSAMKATGVGESHVAQDVEIVLMSANPGAYKTVSGNKVPTFVWGLKDGLANGTTGEYGYMNSSNTSSGGWNKCARRTWCNSVFYNALPAGFRSVVSQVKVVTADGTLSSTATSNDYCFLAAEKEVFGSNTYADSTAEASLSVFGYYRNGNRIKKCGPNGSANRWWLRSPWSGYSGGFCGVDGDGGANAWGAGGTHLLAPCGCF